MSSMTARRRFAAACLALAIAGCTQFLVRSHRDPAAAFGSFRTYAWLPKDQAEPADQNVPHRGFDRRIRAKRRIFRFPKGQEFLDGGTRGAHAGTLDSMTGGAP